MNRTLVIVLALAVLFGGAVATAATFTDGDEVAPGSEVYLDAADSDNGDEYVRFDATDEIRLQFDALPPDSRTRADDLFVVGFAGYEDSDDAATVRLETTDNRVAIERMDTGESFGSGTIELEPGGSVVFGAVVSTNAQDFLSSIELEVDVPDTGDSTGGSGASDTDGDDSDDQADDDDADTPEETTEDDDGADGELDDTDDDTAGDDATDPGVDTDTDSGAGLIELAGFGSPVSLVAVGALAAILSLSYAARLELIAGGPVGNTGGPE